MRCLTELELLLWDAMVAFVSQSKRATLRDSQLDEMGVKHGLKQNDKVNQNSLYTTVRE